MAEYYLCYRGIAVIGQRGDGDDRPVASCCDPSWVTVSKAAAGSEMGPAGIQPSCSKGSDLPETGDRMAYRWPGWKSRHDGLWNVQHRMRRTTLDRGSRPVPTLYGLYAHAAVSATRPPNCLDPTHSVQSFKRANV